MRGGKKNRKNKLCRQTRSETLKDTKKKKEGESEREREREIRKQRNNKIVIEALVQRRVFLRVTREMIKK